MGSAWVWLNLRTRLLEVVAVLFALATLPPSLVESVVLELAPLRVCSLVTPRMEPSTWHLNRALAAYPHDQDCLIG